MHSPPPRVVLPALALLCATAPVPPAMPADPTSSGPSRPTAPTHGQATAWFAKAAGRGLPERQAAGRSVKDQQLYEIA